VIKLSHELLEGGIVMARKILVVDDELKMVKLITTYLRNSGFSVITAYDGQKALSVFQVDQGIPMCQ
jgi:CheY-like chemotaxis protein